MSEMKEFVNKYSRVIVLGIITVALLVLIILNLGTFGNVLLVLLGFGAVVMVHEFGHFIAAKIGGIKVEAFSIFMPPILFGIQRTENGIRFRILPEILPKEDDESGEGVLSFTVGSKGEPSDTEYRIGLIPFGGFVKMLGQDDTGPAKETEDPRSFMNKPLGTRAAVLAAGVTCNVISAIIIFMIAFLIGINLPPAVVGDVIPGSPADLAGLKPGDEIIEIDGKDKDLDFTNIALVAALSGRDEKVPMTVRRPDGSEEKIELGAEELPGQPMRGFGIIQPQSLEVAELSRKSDINYLEAGTGLLPGDRVVSVNGKSVTAHWELRQIIDDTFAPEATLSAKRRTGDETETIETALRLRYGVARNIEGDLSHVYSMIPRLRIESLNMDYVPPAEGPRLEKGDTILAIGELENPTYEEMRQVTSDHKDKELLIKVLRESADRAGQTLMVTATPRKSKVDDGVMIGFAPVLDLDHPIVAATIDVNDGPVKLDIPRGAAITAVDGVAVKTFYDVIREIRRYPGERITIDWRLDGETAGNVALQVDKEIKFVATAQDFAEVIPFDRLERKYKASGPVDAVIMGFRKTRMFIAQTYVTLRRLIGGLVSPKNLMGPLGIIKASYTIVDQQPFIYYVYFLGLINAVIAVFNFLPLPPLDGGLVVLLLVEKVRGAAFSERVQAVIAYTGWILILVLFLYVTINDIDRTGIFDKLRQWISGGG